MNNLNKNMIHNEFNIIMKANEDIYRNLAKIVGLSDSAFWILYALRDSDSVITQSEVCNILYQPKQTVNTSLKKMESDGYIELVSINDRRSKQVFLTEKGIELAQKTVDRVISMERDALSGLVDTEQETFVRLFKKYTNLLQENISLFKNDVD